MPSDLEAADEVFITSTTRDLLPVFQIEDKQISRADNTRTRLQEAFSEFVRDYVDDAPGGAGGIVGPAERPQKEMVPSDLIPSSAHHRHAPH